ncbi:MAG TPA: DUF4342 domain-containing protein [Bryobacteraceae bacterium]|nr:DUF4342 domain-containing protein [Bryobacteraceae bacterium]
MDQFGRIFEQIKVHAGDLADKVKELVHEGNVRRIIIKDEGGHTFMEIPLSVATVGVVLAPILAAVAAIATVVSHFEVVVERTAPPGARSAASGANPSTGGHSNVTDPSAGATESQMNMAGTVGQKIDKKGTKLEDTGGTGEHDSHGG